MTDQDSEDKGPWIVVGILLLFAFLVLLARGYGEDVARAACERCGVCKCR